MCRVIKVTRSSYYDWRNSCSCNRVLQDRELSLLIKALFEEGRGNYGSRSIKKRLEHRGRFISRRRVIRLMRSLNLCCRIRRSYRFTTDSSHKLPIAPNLLNRQFNVERVNSYYVGDITYIATCEGWLYLATVIDLYSRRVVGWGMEDNMKSELVNKALLMAIGKRKPGVGLVWHTDRGSQYASESHLRIIKQYGIIQSMSRKGDCWDNAVAESFFHTLKNEIIGQNKFKTREEAKNVIFEYIEVFYNRIRAHSTNNYLSPVEYEKIKNVA